jgi:hypothetical protein
MPPSPIAHLARRTLSPAARAMRLQRIFARLQEGADYAEIAAEERISRERLGRIIRRATARGRDGDQPDHTRMQIARLSPALRLAAAGVAQGDQKAIPLLLSLVDRLDRYSDPDTSFRSSPLEEFISPRPRVRRIRAPRRTVEAPKPASEPHGEDGVRSPSPASGKSSP